MILFLEDWKKYKNSIVDLQTKNKSFLRLAGVYKAMGIENHAFLLALHNPALQGVDPFDPNLSLEQMAMIAVETKENPWYYLREIVRVPSSGSGSIPIEANRGNIALYWLFFNHITTFLIQCRQTGKSLSSDTLSNYVRCIAGNNTDIFLLTKDDNLRVRNIQRLKELQAELPHYLNLKSKKDADNTEKMTCVRLGNTLYTGVGQPSIEASRKTGRGLSNSVCVIDELAYIPNIDIVLPSLLSSAGAARESSKKNNSPYSILFTSTAGYLSTKSGRFCYNNVYKPAFRWTEKLFDCKNEEETVELIKKNTPRGEALVLCEFNHRQLGKTDEWLRERITSSFSTGEDTMADFLNIWPAGNEQSPIDKNSLNKIINSRVGDPYTEISEYGYITRWYVSEQEVKNKLSNRTLVMGMDTSEAIGNDDICKTIIDVNTGEVIATGVYNETNIITFSNWLADFLIKYPNITLVIERKSTGLTIVDNLILILTAKGIDPFKRLFNWVINDSSTNKEYYNAVYTKDIYYRDESVYTNYRKHFGYATAGSGRSSRDNLYGTTFKFAIKYLAGLIRDNTLISQLQTLVYKNGRIDHLPGEHDDAVISLLLPIWFLTNAKNLSYYGIDSKRILSRIYMEQIEEQGGTETIQMREEQNKIKDEIEDLIQELKHEKSPYKSTLLISRIKHLYNHLSTEDNLEFNLDNLLSSIKNKLNNNSKYMSYR